MLISTKLCVHHPQTNISSRFYRNCETFIPKFKENIEKMFPRYNMHSDVLCINCHEINNQNTMSKDKLTEHFYYLFFLP